MIASFIANRTISRRITLSSRMPGTAASSLKSATKASTSALANAGSSLSAEPNKSAGSETNAPDPVTGWTSEEMNSTTACCALGAPIANPCAIARASRLTGGAARETALNNACRNLLLNPLTTWAASSATNMFVSCRSAARCPDMATVVTGATTPT
ncbi:unannotated protein [freshwater metagenome]|uniref:Unannotated protein n=1 Tax=freshwater metagenome TaxID=449393 RepID=A0A6J7SGV0_9ZZZZ